MVRIDELASQVKRNCRISDARSWGYHSVCGLLLRLRELYKWEQGLEPWDKVETSEVLPWIGSMESLWEELQEAELERLVIDEQSVDPFDADTVNNQVVANGFYYAAGHGMAMKPLFVLGKIIDRRTVEGSEIVFLGREFVRDLSPTPAMNRAGTIIARREVMKWFLWQWLEEAGMKRDQQIGALALREDEVELSAVLADPSSYRDYLEGLADREMEAAVHHELGEIREEERLAGRWQHAFSHSCGTKAELLARGLKDVLADTGEGGRLAYMIQNRALVSLGLYAAFNEGLRRDLFPELGELFLRLLDDDNWNRLEKARKTAHRRLRAYVEPLLGIFEEELSAEESARRADALEDKMLN